LENLAKYQLKNSSKGATHAAFYNFQSEEKYLPTDTDVNNWYHWVGDTRHYVD
jgi:hypothetical protein